MRALIALCLVAAASTAHADRIKDLASIAGVRDNHLTGFGLVVGLDGTGDDARSPMVKDSLAKMLKRLGITIDAEQIKAKNVAAVALTAELPAFAKPGMAFDVTISSIGNAKSISGGTLLVAPLKGPDGNTWALVQGAVSTGGFVAAGGTGSSTKQNHPTVGRIPGGGIVEAAAPTVMPAKEIVFVLHAPDFTTASRATVAIDAVLGAGSARALDASSIAIAIKAEQRANVAALIAQLEAIEVEPDLKAKVIVDEKTGTIVVGEAVVLRAAAISFGALVVEIEEQQEASQPAGFAGETKVIDKTKVTIDEKANPMRVVSRAATVGDVAAALASLGAKPRELVSILRALKASGALRAQLETL